MLKETVERLIRKEEVREEKAIQEIFEGGDPHQIAAFLTLLSAKGETKEELILIIRYLQKHMIPLDVKEDAVDIVGTGGDGKKSVNISTAAAILAASAGAKVIKHGNSSVSSSSGAADVLRVLGIDIHMSPVEAAKCFEALGITFCLAPNYHPKLAKVREIRKKLGIPTCFNLIGPLLNPAKAPYLILGVYAEKFVPLIAEILFSLKIKRAFVFHSSGYDELTTLTKTIGLEVSPQGIKPFEIDPLGLGFSPGKEEELKGGTPEENARKIIEVFQGKEGTLLDTIVLNAAAALYVSGKASSLKEGVEKAKGAIHSQKTLGLLERWKEFSKKDILSQILERKKEEVEHLKKTLPSTLTVGRKTLSLKKALFKKPGVIAEIKRASPSKGKFAALPDPVSVAVEYIAGGARVLSVLTDAAFVGSQFDLQLVSQIKERPPILRKDFIIDPVQLKESLLLGADAVLLIAKVLQDRLKEMIQMASELGLEALVEVNDEKELFLAIEAGAEIIGINQRNLNHFEVDDKLAEKLLSKIPEGTVKIAASGIKTPEDVKKLLQKGFDGVLVGETLSLHKTPSRWIEEASS